MKSISKKTVAKWKNEANRTGGGPNTATKPNEMQFRIANFIGHVHTFGIPGTEKCDIAAVTTSYTLKLHIILQHQHNYQLFATVICLTPKILRLSTPTAALGTHCR